MSGEARFKEVAIGICESRSFKNPSFDKSGAFKEVYCAKTSEGLPVALKIFDPNKCNLCRAEREILSVQRCESPFIGKIFDWGIFKNSSGVPFLFVIEEYFAGGTLTDRLNSMIYGAIHVCNYGIPLLNALLILKDNLLVHRDIKPDNIMFRSTDDLPVLVDFGLVRDLSATSLTNTYLQQGPGTPLFASPEQLNNDKHLIDWRSDQFCIGVVLGICLTGCHPYQQPNQTAAQTVEQVAARTTCSSWFSEKANKSGCHFLTKMVSPWPINRFAHPDLILRELGNLKREISI